MNAESLADADSRVQVEPGLLMELHSAGRGHYGRLLTFVVVYLAAAYGAYRLAGGLAHSAWGTIALVPLIVLAAASLHGISLFTHEGVHGTLSLNRHWNRWLSMLCALPVLQNYSAYR